MFYSCLALEVRLEIIPYLDRTSLKHMRLVDAGVEPAASAALFEEISFCTDIHSWNHIRRIAFHPRLRHLVKTICYHDSTIASNGGHMFSLAVLEYRARMLPDMDMNEWFRMYSTLIKDQAVFQGVPHYIRVLSKTNFPNMSHLLCTKATLDIPFACFDAFDRYADKQLHRSVYTFQRGSMRLPFDSLSIDPARWEDLPTFVKDEGQVERDQFTLRSVELSLPIKDFHLKHESRLSLSSTCLEPFRNCFYYWRAVERLRLHFRDNVQHRSCIFELAKISQTLASHQFDRLSYLSLSTFYLHKPSFLRMLQNNLMSISSLVLEDIFVVPDRGSQTFESVIALFHEIPGVCNLETVRIKGLFTNLLDEAWLAHEDGADADSLRARFEGYMSHRGPWPILPLNDYIDALETRRELKADDPALFEELVSESPVGVDLKDESWLWCPGDNDVWFLVDDLPDWADWDPEESD